MLWFSWYPWRLCFILILIFLCLLCLLFGCYVFIRLHVLLCLLFGCYMFIRLHVLFVVAFVDCVVHFSCHALHFFPCILLIIFLMYYSVVAWWFLWLHANGVYKIENFHFNVVRGSTAEMLCGLKKGDVVELSQAMGRGFDIDQIQLPEKLSTILIFASGSGIRYLRIVVYGKAKLIITLGSSRRSIYNFFFQIV